MVVKWIPPSFDPKPPQPFVEAVKATPIAESAIKLPTIEELEEIRRSAYEEAYQKGFALGKEKGEAEGLQVGTTAGAQAGYKQAYEDAKPGIDALTTALQEILQALQGLPEAISTPLHELAYELAVRISGNESLERGPFIAAVQEAMMRLPSPGENLFLRIREEEHEMWNRIVTGSGLPFTCTVLLDRDVPAGHAYVEINGARIDIGYEARKALARSTLGLNATDSFEC
jgi:flagellar assembly protein FliH